MCVCVHIQVHTAIAGKEQVREQLLRVAQSEPYRLLVILEATLWSTGNGGLGRAWGRRGLVND